MNKKIIPAVVLFLAMAGNSSAQSEHLALKSMRKQKWDRAHLQLHKARQKDRVSAAVSYVHSLYFSSIQNPDYQIDSASKYANWAWQTWAHSDPKQREKLKRFPLDSVILKRQRDRIDSAAFERAQKNNTEKGYIDFLQYFPDALQHDQAIMLRDEVAYHDALETNTYQSFSEFLANYPNSKKHDEAREKYEKLLYEYKTADGRLRSYESFLQEHPSTPYRKNSEENIFEIATASGGEIDYQQFIERYPESSFAGKGRNILYYILFENDPDKIPELLPGDSVKAIQMLDQDYLIPFYTENKYGFMNEFGNEVIKARYDSISKKYICGNIKDDFIVFPDKVVARNDKIIFTGKIRYVTDLGYGFLEIDKNDCREVVHKSGFTVGDHCIQEGKIVAGKFVAIKQHDQWSLWTLSGRRVIQEDWDEITNIKEVIIFKRGGHVKLATAKQIGMATADHQNLKTQDIFDEVKAWPHDLIWARTADYQGILDQSLTIILPFENHSLVSSFFGTISSFPAGKKIYTGKAGAAANFKNVKASEPWVAVNQENTWQLFDPITNQFLSAPLDSITFVGPFSIGHSSDTLRVYFNPKTYRDFRKCTLEFIPGKDSTSFLVVSEMDKKSVYNVKGHKLFSGVYDAVQYAGHAIFIVSKKEKKGLVQRDGKVLLPCEYDAIGSVTNNAISLLKKLKFGLYNIITHKQIKPQYDKNLTLYNDKLLVAYKDGLSGFIDWNNKALGTFEFEEVLYWNDTTAFVKKNFQWKLFQLYKNKVLIDNIKSYKTVSDTGDEKIFIVNFGNEVGVIGNKRGTILPFTFNGIKNLGPPDEPFYFAEKHVEEAAVFIVTYYNKKGELIRRQVYQEEDYEQIYCQDN